MHSRATAMTGSSLSSLVLLVPLLQLFLTSSQTRSVVGMTTPQQPQSTIKSASTIQGRNGQWLRVSWEIRVAELIRAQMEQHCATTTTSADNDKDRTQQRPYMVAICGIPGSGKSSGAEIITHLLRDHNEDVDGADQAFLLPADGYHYPLAKLQAMQENGGSNNHRTADLVYRRGAPDTFDVAALRRDLLRIRNDNRDGSTIVAADIDTATSATSKEKELSTTTTIALPGFDHAVGDPVSHQHVFDRDRHRVVICEGLYLLLDDDTANPNSWAGLRDLFDWTVYVEADLDVCMDRLKIRNQCLPGYTPAEISARVDAVDRVNAIQVQSSSPKRAHLIVRSAAE